MQISSWNTVLSLNSTYKKEEEEEMNIYPKVRYFYSINKNGTFLSPFKSFTRSPIPFF